MPEQAVIAKHLDLSQPAVSKMLRKLGLTGQETLDEIRVAYIRNLREVAAGHRSEEGLDLVQEKAKTERVDRELKLLQLAEKKRELVNLSELHGELSMVFIKFRETMLDRASRLKTQLDALYGTDIDPSIIEDDAYSTLQPFAEYLGINPRGTEAAGGDTASAAPDRDD